MEEEIQVAQLEKLRAEIRKLGRESDKLMVETRWYPLVVSGVWTAAIIAVTKLFL
jgi:hypothetical protein